MYLQELETKRLTFRQFKETDFEIFSTYFANAETTRFLGGVKTDEQAWRLLAAYIGHFQMKGFGYMAVEEKVSGKFVGCVGLWKSAPWPELELGYWFLQEMQGKGYATEAALKVKEFAIHKMQAPNLVSYIDPENAPSIRLAERIGARYEATINLLDFGPHGVYRYIG